ncbi:uncharacterized protein LOC123308803 [Coccinella septempunctata]|uniref:uncharacterized protein LOC123308803 n=1 Tax=Coccinella septempunctata TaxID=41139 RepID=UPI001D08A654|nr:uncharacterized protein LOC123308803 [Coccinella septempunctata]
MGNLPKSRFSTIKAFLHCGCDYAGPFTIAPMRKYRGQKTSKAYICLFVCHSTKAVHLELANDLSYESFLAALQRFIARRGRCTDLYCDNGTNFVGTNRELIKLMKIAAEREVIRFHFNPPSGSHFGGLFEAAVKSVKSHFYRVIGSQILTFEEFYTLLTLIESVLNSRPLCATSSDPDDLNCLTPGHFLTLEPLTAIPIPDLTDQPLNRLSRWQLLQSLHQHFWARWRNEYLHSLQQRVKWCDISTPALIGQLVVIKTDKVPPNQWRLGRITTLFPGSDGVARVARVKTQDGTFTRPLVKLCPLPVCDGS